MPLRVDVVWVVSSVTKTIRGVSTLYNATKQIGGIKTRINIINFTFITRSLGGIARMRLAKRRHSNDPLCGSRKFVRFICGTS